MNKTVLIQFVSIIFIILIQNYNAYNLFRGDQIYQLSHFDVKYKEGKQKVNNFNKKYLVIIKIGEKVDKDIKSEEKRIARLNYDFETKQKRLKDDIILSQHNARMKEVIDFMKDHMMTTKYLYEEVKRIKRDRQIKDDLREMVAYLEKPENEEEKTAVLNCFAKNKKVLTKKKKNVWDQKSNDLVINVIKDPFNDGTIN